MVRDIARILGWELVLMIERRIYRPLSSFLLGATGAVLHHHFETWREGLTIFDPAPSWSLTLGAAALGVVSAILLALAAIGVTQNILVRTGRMR